MQFFELMPFEEQDFRQEQEFTGSGRSEGRCGRTWAVHADGS